MGHSLPPVPAAHGSKGVLFVCLFFVLLVCFFVSVLLVSLFLICWFVCLFLFCWFVYLFLICFNPERVALVGWNAGTKVCTGDFHRLKEKVGGWGVGADCQPAFGEDVCLACCI